MSDHQQGPGWWLASDGRWYPPESAPPVPPTETWDAPTPSPPPSGGSGGSKVALIVGGVVVALALLVGAVAALGSGDDGDDDTGDGTTTTETAGGPEDVPEGYELVEGDGVSIAVPEGWVAISAEDLSEGIDLSEAFPDAPPGLLESGAQAVEQGAVLVAIDANAAAFADSVNVIRAPGEAPLELIEPQARSQIEQLGGTVLDSGEASLPAGDAVWITYTIDVTMPDGSTSPASGVQYYLPAGGSTFIVTITSDDDVDSLGEDMLPTFAIA